MGIAKSKIPPEKPGQVLKNTGIQEFDDFYSKIEPDIKLVLKRKHDLDLRTTELIESLDASDIWEINPKIEVILHIMLTIFTVAGSGNLSSVIQFIQHSPYFQNTNNNLPYKYSSVFTKFTALIKSISKITIQLSEVKISSKTIELSTQIQNTVANKVIELDYKIKEKLECIKNVNQNHRLLQIYPQDYENLLRFSHEFKEIVLKAINDSQLPPLADLLQQRSIQCISSCEKSPCQITKKFWRVC